MSIPPPNRSPERPATPAVGAGSGGTPTTSSPLSAIPAIISTGGGGSSAMPIKQATSLAIQAIARFENIFTRLWQWGSYLCPCEGILEAYAALPEVLRLNLVELFYPQAIARFAALTLNTVTLQKIREHIEMLYDFDFRDIPRDSQDVKNNPELGNLISLLEGGERNPAILLPAFDAMDHQSQAWLCDLIRRAHAYRAVEEQLAAQTKEEVVKKFISTDRPDEKMWLEALARSLLSTTGKVDALRDRILGMGDLDDPDAALRCLADHPKEALRGICSLLTDERTMAIDNAATTAAALAFFSAVIFAAKTNDLESLKLLSQSDQVSEFTRSAAREAAASAGHIEAVQALMSPTPSEKELQGVLSSAAKTGQLKVIDTFLPPLSSFDLLQDITLAATRRGQLTVIQHLIPRIKKYCKIFGPLHHLSDTIRHYFRNIARIAAENNHADIVKLFIENFGCDPQKHGDLLCGVISCCVHKEDAELTAFYYGQIAGVSGLSYTPVEILKVLASAPLAVVQACYPSLQRDQEQLLSEAAKVGNIEVVSWLLTQEIQLRTLQQAIIEATTHGHLTLLQKLLEVPGLELPDNIISKAIIGAVNGIQKNTLPLLLAGRRLTSEEELKNAAVKAALHGRIDVLRLLFPEGSGISPQILPDAVRAASSNGLLATLEFLLPPGRALDPGTLQDAVNEAITTGRLDIVRLLLSGERRVPDEDRFLIIGMAASRGDAPFLEFLLQQGPITRLVRERARAAIAQLWSPDARRMMDLLDSAPLTTEASLDAPPPTTTAIADETLYTTFEEVAEGPLRFLDLIHAGRFPRRVVLLNEPQAVDLGGVTKQFLSTLVEGLRKAGAQFGLPDDGFPVPEVQHAPSIDFYAKLGAFFSQLVVRNAGRSDKFVTGPLFHPLFFAVVKAYAQNPTVYVTRTEEEKEALRKEIASLIEPAVPHLACYAHAILHPEDEANLTTCKAVAGLKDDTANEAVLKVAREVIDGVIESAEAFYHGSTDALQEKLQVEDPTTLAQDLQGKPITTEAILQALKPEGAQPAFTERLGWIREKIASSDDKWRKRFVASITGNSVLAPGARISISPSIRGQGEFEVHTCFNSLNIPLWFDKEDFLLRLDDALQLGYNIA